MYTGTAGNDNTCEANHTGDTCSTGLTSWRQWQPSAGVHAPKNTAVALAGVGWAVRGDTHTGETVTEAVSETFGHAGERTSFQRYHWCAYRIILRSSRADPNSKSVRTYIQETNTIERAAMSCGHASGARLAAPSRLPTFSGRPVRQTDLVMAHVLCKTGSPPVRSES